MCVDLLDQVDGDILKQIIKQWIKTHQRKGNGLNWSAFSVLKPSLNHPSSHHLMFKNRSRQKVTYTIKSGCLKKYV